MGVGAASPPVGLANVYHQVPLRRTLPCLRLQGGSYYRHEERTDPVWLAGRYYDAEITVHKHALPEKAFLEGANLCMVFDLILRAS